MMGEAQSATAELQEIYRPGFMRDVNPSGIIPMADGSVYNQDTGKLIEARAYKPTPPNPSGIIPMDLRVLILPDKIEERTKGGIILTEKVIEKGEYAQCKATIVALGENAFAEAERSAIERGVAYRRPAPGDRILIALYGGTRPEGKDGVTYRLVNDEDIVARLED